MYPLSILCDETSSSHLLLAYETSSINLCLTQNRDDTSGADRKVRRRDALRVPLVANHALGPGPALCRSVIAVTTALLPRVLKIFLRRRGALQQRSWLG